MSSENTIPGDAPEDFELHEVEEDEVHVSPARVREKQSLPVSRPGCRRRYDAQNLPSAAPDSTAGRDPASRPGEPAQASGSARAVSGTER